MSTFFTFYTVLWIIACLIALALYIRDAKSIALSGASYWRFLFRPWKVITFLLALLGLIVVVSVATAPDLDVFDAVLMGVLTFLTAPWAIGALYKSAKGEVSLIQGYVALCVWLFCAAWVFDAYILIKNGTYPYFWPIYMLGTLGLYVLGGLFWNLDWEQGRGTIFAFMTASWPEPRAGTVFPKIFSFALLFMAAVSFLFIVFFWQFLLSMVR